MFRNLRVGDGNGAGIRTESGDLRVQNSMFLDSQEGILGNQDTPQRITVDHSTFSGLGQCDETPDCAHSIYLANQGTITVTNSRFERGRGGHYVKLRTPTVDIAGNSFDDTRGSKTNYMIDPSEGGTGRIAGNTFVQGRNKENWSALIAVAAEKRTYGSAGLRIADNDARLAPGAKSGAVFVADMGMQALSVGMNRLGAEIKAYEKRWLFAYRSWHARSWPCSSVCRSPGSRASRLWLRVPAFAGTRDWVRLHRLHVSAGPGSRSRQRPSWPDTDRPIVAASVGMMSTVSTDSGCSKPDMPRRQKRIGTRRS